VRPFSTGYNTIGTTDENRPFHSNPRLCVTASTLENRANAYKNGGRRVDEDFAVLGVCSITEGVLG
jgi:hypothetical protein